MEKYELSSTKEDGTPWWQVGGTKSRLAAYLWFNVPLGETFTMAQVREATETVTQTQTDRRLRELREQGWQITGYKEKDGLRSNTYRLVAYGKKLWLGEKVKRDVISNKIRRIVFERDNNTCVICSTSAGEAYIDIPGSRARMTIGHRIPNQRLGEATLENLQTECSRCNEPLRDLLENPEVLENILPDLEILGKEELEQLDSWLEQNSRKPSPVDTAYARIRKLTSTEKERARSYINRLLSNLE